MNNIIWKDSYKIGVEFIDKEHKLLFSTMNKLMKFSEDEEKSEWVCREGVKYLKNHAVEHFEHEEDYMRSINYSEFEIHKRQHDCFRYKTLPALEEEMEENRYSVESIRHFLGVCIGWVVGHTQTEDQAIAGRGISKWIDLPCEEEKEALTSTIIQLGLEMFRMKMKVISEHYAGEDFGNMLCCRFYYRGSGKGKWEVTLIFENRLLLKIIGGILMTEYSRVDDMVINVIRYISRQFLDRLCECFPSIELMELEKECLLTHEQLMSSYERDQPAYSLLFGTGEGYFAFSVSTDDSIRGKIIPVINHQNAMAAVKDYLVREGEEQKKRRPKILVVDDSEFMRCRIIKLLADSYELVEANSSIAAIRSIMLNRPDLVLLDYAMPICDGRQALEMIRSEKDIADVPVMFLTGRGDAESVRKVMSLKPEGYLLKTLPDGDIKSMIDEFFEKQNA